MRKIFFLVAFLSASIMSFADKVYDVNFALASEGSSATASSGNAALAIDGDNGTRWESAQTDDETWTLDMGQARTFSRIKIYWEGAYAKEFTLSISNDGESWSNLYTETNLTQFGWQTIDVDETTARYIQYHGTKRATQWGQSFFEFQVLLPGVSVLTKIELSAPTVAKVAEGVSLAARALDQNNTEMSVALSYEITPADAGAVVDGKYVPAKVGNASIVAKSGTVSSPAIEIFGYEGTNLALSTNIVTDNKIIAQSDFAPNGTDAFYAVDGNDGSVYQGSATNGTAEDETSRTFDAWFVVDLGANYSIDLITIYFEGACAQDYHVDFSENNTDWVLGYNHIGTAGVNGRTDMLSTKLDNNNKVRYVRFWSTKAGTKWGMKIFEFQVFGREYVASDDTEKPVMVSASLVSKTGTSAVIAVEATDNDEVAKYRVVETNHGIDAKYVANEGKITITGLQGATTYAFVITAFDAAQNESANSKVVNVTTDAHYDAPQAACTAPTLPDAQVKAIYSPTYNANCNFQDWGSGTVYTETEFGKKFVIGTNGGGYFGMDGFVLNCLLMEKLHADIWIADDATLRLVPIYGGAGLATDDTHGKFVSLTGGQWNSIDLDLATDYAGLNLASIFQFKIDNAANLTIWLGNLYFYRAEPIVDDEAPTNVQASAAGSGYFSATLAVSAEDNSGVVNYRVLNGETEVANGGGASGQTVHITIPNLKANTEYTFSVVAVDANNNLAEPVTVKATTLAAPAPAALPTYDAADVQGVFTDNYKDVEKMDIEDWWAEPAISAGLLAEKREALCITPNTTASSCFGLAFPETDISAYTALEMDVYPMVANGVLDIQVIGVGAASTTFNLTANEWNHIVLDIKGNTKTDCKQIGFYNCDKLLGVCFVQNVLFVQKGDTTAVDQVDAATKAVKMIENGQLIILRDGKRYTITGVRVK